MLITAIRQTSSDRLTVVLEDESEIRSTLGVITDLRLYSGRDLEEDALEELRCRSARALGRERALELISRRAMSRKELRDKLLQKGETEDTAEYCAQWLEENGFLNDENYAAAVARHYAAKGYGVGRVRSELSRRGIARELWDEAMEAMPEPDDKLEKFISSRLKDPQDRVQVQKISNALYRRGYSWEEIRSALRRHQAKIEEY
ncbi:MAG: regulatory protein RecX [Oscillospiraceae bacterium]|nr:regulatory protein RecX [Oscillospiraceae bacterium]